MEYIDQSAQSIRYSLIEGAVPKAAFRILEEQTIEWNGLTITPAILGESHLIVFQSGLERLNEICACSPIEIDSSYQIHQSEVLLTNLPQPLTHVWSGYQYRFNYKLVPLEEEKTHHDSFVRSENSAICEEFVFPTMVSNLSRPATTVCVKGVGTDLHTFTSHSYPNENRTVITNSFLISLS